MRHYAELHSGLCVIMRNCKVDYTSLCGIANWSISHYAESHVKLMRHLTINTAMSLMWKIIE